MRWMHGSGRPNRTGCTERQWVTSLDDSNTVRIEYRIWKRGGLADFVILIQRLGTQGWDEVERFDCCHGHCHLHPDGQAESETLYQLDGPDDVQEAYAKASVYAGERARIIRDKGGE